MASTIEDIYTAVIESDRGVKEKVWIFDTAGLVRDVGTLNMVDPLKRGGLACRQIV